MNNEITQYELANALEKIKGYWVPRPNESRQDCFNRAKQEYINALNRYIMVAEAVPENWENMILADKKADKSSEKYPALKNHYIP